MKIGRNASTFVVVIILLAFAAPGGADPSPDSTLMKGFERLDSGNFRVPLSDGTDLQTHGYDAKPNHGSWSWISRSLLRQPICATDYYVHVLYGRLSSGADRYSSQRPEILTTVKNTNYLLNSEGVESGGHNVDYKVQCDAFGEIDVGSFTAPSAGFQAVVDAARAAGYNKTNVKYWIFFDTDAVNYCGISSFRSDERPAAANTNNSGGSYSVSHRDCWAGRTPMHEVGHAMGAVQYNAPSSTGSGGHCNQDIDVMCYSPDGGDKNQSGTVDACLDHTHFDCQHDTYFDTAVEPGEYLEANWNAGSTVNRFLAFDQTPVPPSNRPPTATFTWRCPSTGCEFVDGSSDFDGRIVSRLWQFGDGTTATSSTVTHVYNPGGAYTVTLTVTDDGGAAVSLSKPVAYFPQDPDPATPSLTRNGYRTETMGGQGTWKYYKVLITEELPSLKVILDGPPCTQVWPCDRSLQLTVPQYGYPYGGVNLDLYTRLGSKPTSSMWACRPYASHSDEACNVTKPTPGVWYIAVNVYWRSISDAAYFVGSEY